MKMHKFLVAVLGMMLVDGVSVGQELPPKRVYGVGIVGNCCTHGAGLCALFQERKDTRVVAAFEPNPRRAQELAKTWGQALSNSYDAVIHDPKVDIIVISCDPSEKAAMVEKAAAVAKAILLNKPACDSLDAARRIAKAVTLAKVPFVYDIPMVRSEPAFARLQTEMRSHSHGKLLGYHHLFGMSFDPAFDLKGTWPERLDPASKSGGGELTNMGCYAIDYAVRLLGRPKSVLAKTRREWDVYREADVENFGQIVLDYGDFFAMLEAGKQQLLPPLRHANALTISFEHRAIHIDTSAHQASINHVPQDWDTFTQDARAVSSADRLIRAMREKRPAEEDVTAIVDATEVLMAAYQSSLQNGRPVSLPLAQGGNPLTRARAAATHAQETATPQPR